MARQYSIKPAQTVARDATPNNDDLFDPEMVEEVSGVPAKRIAQPPAKQPDATSAPVEGEVDPQTASERALAIGASQLKLTEAEQDILMAPPHDDDVLIRPDGIVYLAHVHLRQRLNRAVGIGQWAMVPQGPPMHNPQRNTISTHCVLFIRGCFVKQAVGEQEYHPNSGTMSYADALEGAESNALTRCCKNAGIGLELWDKRWRNGWLSRCAVKVRVRKRDQSVKLEWRRADEPPLPGEFEVVTEQKESSASSGGGAARRGPVSTEREPQTRAVSRPTAPVSRPLPDPDAGGDDSEVLEERFVGSKPGSKPTQIWVHRDWNADLHISKAKINAVMIHAFIAARQGGADADSQSDVARKALSQAAGEAGMDHFSLCPFTPTSAYEDLRTRVAELLS